MRFRTKLLLLLLSLSLCPMLLLRCYNQREVTDMGTEIAERINNQLITSSKLEMRQRVTDHAFLFKREGQLLELALRTQATALLEAIEGETPRPPMGDTAPIDAALQSERHCRIRGDGTCSAATLDYDRFSILPPESAGQNVSSVLATLTPLFRDLAARTPELLLWQYVCFNDDTQAVFPATTLGNAVTKPRHKHMMRRAPEWHKRALAADGPVWGTPQLDPLTRRFVFTVSMAVRSSDKTRTFGSTALVVEVNALLHVDDHLDALSDEMETLIVNLGAPPTANPAEANASDNQPNAEPPTGIRIIASLRSDSAPTPSVSAMGHRRMWHVPEQQQWLQSKDRAALQLVVADLQNSNSGIRELSYKGRPCLWAYGSIKTGGVSLLIIAPKEDIAAQAQTTRDYVLERFQRTIFFSGFLVTVVLVCIMIFSLVLAKRFTKSIEELAQGFAAVGQGDFSVRVQARGKDEIGQLAHGFNHMVPALDERIRMLQSLEMAHEIQRSLLPHEMPVIPGFLSAFGSVYSESTGGDYYDCIVNAGGLGHIGLAVGDVTGHGLPAALLMTTARAFMRQRASAPGGPGDVLADVNRQISRDVDQTGRFITMFYLVLTPGSHVVRWARAGHDPALLYDPHQDHVTELGGQGLPLGTLPDWTFEERERTLAPGQVLCIATDGVWEARGPDDSMYGKQRLQTMIRRCAKETPQRILQAVLEDVRAFQGRDGFEDDITLVIVKAE